MPTVTVFIAKLNTSHTIKVNGVDVTLITVGAENNGFAKVANIDSKLPTVIHNGASLNHVEGEFVEDVFYTATHEGDYLIFSNGGNAITYK